MDSQNTKNELKVSKVITTWTCPACGKDYDPIYATNSVCPNCWEILAELIRENADRFGL